MTGDGVDWELEGIRALPGAANATPLTSLSGHYKGAFCTSGKFPLHHDGSCAHSISSLIYTAFWDHHYLNSCRRPRPGWRATESSHQKVIIPAFDATGQRDRQCPGFGRQERGNRFDELRI